MNQEIINILFNFLPELSLAVSVIILNLLRGFSNRNKGYFYYIFVIGILLSAVFSLLQVYYAPQLLFTGTITADHFAYGGRALVSLAILIIALAFYDKEQASEFSLVLVSVIGALLCISSSNLFVLFISLQVMVIPLYLIIHYEIKPAIKYFISSGIFMAALLYGISLIYGVTGSGDYIEAAKYLSFNPYNVLVMILAVIFIISGFAFLILSAPYNLSFPLLAEKIKLPHLAQFTLINVMTVILVISRFSVIIFHDSNTFITDLNQYSFIAGINWQLMLSVISLISIMAGNFVILWQNDLKKIVTYIVISQAGYLLIGIISGSPGGISAVIFNLIVFAINTLGLLYCINLINTNYKVNDITGLKGLGKDNKTLFLSFIFFLISSAGFPLSAGFTGKIMLYISLGGTPYFWLIAAGVLSTAVFLYFIFKLSITIFSGRNTVKSAKIETFSLILLLILLLPDILLGFYFEPLLNWAKYCSILTGF
ncbi:MAG: proton-conducting transporter membrane subunit [Ignavibacteria bacterium]